MKRLSRWLAVVVLSLTFSAFLPAESVATLPQPTGYVSDFAGVLSPATRQSVEDLCSQVDHKAHAQIAVVTIKTLDGDQSIEEFTTQLEDKWKVGAKGTDRGVVMVFSMSPRKYRIEVGYGLEGILNDAKAGDVGRLMRPYLVQNDFDTGIPLGVQQIAQIIATDAGVTLTASQPIRQYQDQEQPQTVHLSLVQIVVGGGVILLILIFLVSTGNTGLIFFLLGSLLGGGRGGRGGGWGGGGGGDGGGFGGFGGGSSGGGGASGDF
ncbi:MAG: TPM domain-containing protein [Edaphobacter sp.]